jgi:hypothetical protein
MLIPAPGSGPIPHLWIVLTKPVDDTPYCVIVNLTTLKNAQDQTVILDKGDHPFIRHPSAIRYSDAQLAEVERLEADLLAGTAVAHTPCSAKTLDLVQAGIHASPYTPKKIQNFCREQWGRHGRS